MPQRFNIWPEPPDDLSTDSAEHAGGGPHDEPPRHDHDADLGQQESAASPTRPPNTHATVQRVAWRGEHRRLVDRLDDVEEHRRQEDAEERHAEHAAEHRRPERPAHLRAGAVGEHQRHHAEDERERRHQDRPQRSRDASSVAS